MAKYWVVGGEYKNTEFKTFCKGSSMQKFGPYNSYEEAKMVWSSKAWESVDNCVARYQIVQE